MKLFICFFISVVYFNQIKAQTPSPDNFPWSPPGATWVYKMFSTNSNNFIQFSYKKDTIILGKLAKQMEVKTITFVGPQNEGRTVQVLSPEYFYNSNDSVYYLDNDSFKFIYSFNPQLNDKWVTGTSKFYNCITGNAPSVDTFSVNGFSSITYGISSYVLMNIGSQTNYFLLGNILKNIGPLVAPYPILNQSKCCPTGSACDVGSFESIVCYFDNWRNVVPIANQSGISCSNIVTSVAEINVEEKKLIVFPNPVSDRLNLEGLLSIHATYFIYDILGKTIKEGKLIQNFIDINNLNKGIYFLKVVDKGKEIKTKFIKL